MSDIPQHFAFPFRRGRNGHVATADQDSPEHIDACAQTVIRCPLGFHDEIPDFGWPFPVFKSGPIDTRPIVDALVKWGHPLGSPSVTEYKDTVDSAIRFIDIIEQAREA